MKQALCDEFKATLMSRYSIISKFYSDLQQSSCKFSTFTEHIPYCSSFDLIVPPSHLGEVWVLYVLRALVLVDIFVRLHLQSIWKIWVSGSTYFIVEFCTCEKNKTFFISCCLSVLTFMVLSRFLTCLTMPPAYIPRVSL